MLTSFRPVALTGIALVLVLLMLPALPAAATPLEAIFFDLGNTLIESDGNGQFVVRTGARETVEELQRLGLEVGVITNVPAGWTRDDLEALLVEPSFLDLFSVVVLSSQAPASKPDPAIYTFAHGQLSGPATLAETAFVGETLAEIADAEVNPTAGCRAVGMIGIHLSDQAPSPLTDYTIPTDDLPQIIAIVEPLNEVFVDGFEDGDTTSWATL